MGSTAEASRGRILAFRIVAGFLGLIAFVPSVLFVIGSFTDEAQDIHLVHNVSGLAGYGLVFGAAGLVMASRPRDSEAAFRALAFSAVVSLLAGLIAGDVVSGFWFIGAVFAIVLFALHPDRADAIRVRSVSPTLLGLGLVALVAAGVFALHQTELQRNGIPAVDPHAEFHHYSGMAVMALVLAAGALAAATGGGGWRVIGWATGIGAALYGAASLAYSDHVGTIDAPWAVVTLIWGCALIAVTEFEVRRAAWVDRARADVR
ncbi:MAG TPA: hypothetical protein VFT27_11365 [Actinomycetota bacterium]|nr:hypothetical protein [Actinomycetota bacterium]